MNITDLVSSLSLQKQKELASQWGVKASGPKANEQTAQLIVIAYRDNSIMKKMLNLLSPDHLNALQMLISLSTTYHNGMTFQHAVRKVNELPPMRGKGDSTVQLLLTKGFLFRVRYQWQEILTVADEVFFAVLGPLADQLVEQYRTGILPAKKNTASTKVHTISYIGGKDQSGEIKIIENHSLSLYHDLITFVTFLVNENIEITQKNHIFKRTMQRMIEKFRSDEGRFPAMINEDLPKHFLFLEQFLLRGSFLKFQTYAKLNIDAFFILLSVPYTEWINPLLDFYRSNIYQNRQPIALFNSVLMRIGLDSWVYEDDILFILSEQMRSWQVSLNEQDLMMQFYNPYLLLGLIQRGQDNNGRFVWKWSDWGLEYIRATRTNTGLPNRLDSLFTDKIYVQPNLEIIVPENILPAIRWMISCIAELKQADSVFIYELTKAKVLHALEGGWTYPLICDHLVRFSQVPVAANVLKTLKDWCDNFGKAVIWDVMVVQLNDPAASVFFTKDKKLASFVVARFSDQAFAIHRSDEAAVRKIMAGLGCPIPLLLQGHNAENAARKFKDSRMIDKETAGEQTVLHHLEALHPQAIADFLVQSKVLTKQLIHSDSYNYDDEDDFDDEYDDYDDDDDYYDYEEDEEDVDDGSFDFLNAFNDLFGKKKKR